MEMVNTAILKTSVFPMSFGNMATIKVVKKNDKKDIHIYNSTIGGNLEGFPPKKIILYFEL